MPRPAAAGPAYRIPVFGLYGDSADPRTGGYVHVEPISSRAPAHGWEIKAHRHDGLAQCLLAATGGGVFEIEGEAVPFAAPWFAWIPGGAVHAFRFAEGTEGHVLTASDEVVAAAIEASGAAARLAPLALRPAHGAVPPAAETGICLVATLEAIAREQELPRLGVEAALQARLVLLLVALLRRQALTELADTLGSLRAAEFLRFRAHVERHVRRQDSVAEIARVLGMSRERLYDVTMRAVGRSPQRILHDRLVLECKRALAYSPLPIQQVAAALGFADQAYFSRFFTRHVGVSPRAFRQARRHGGALPPSGGAV